MNLPFIISLPILICLWIYIIILLRNSLLQSTSNQLNFIGFNETQQSKSAQKVNNSFKSIESFIHKRKKIHVPKFMLELYENNRIGGKGKRPDVVKSLIPTHAEPFYDNEILEDFSENHLLIFNIPASDEDEQFVSAELKILTLIEFGENKELGVKRILKMSVYDESIKHLIDFQEVQIHHFNNSWITFDLTNPVNNILRNNSKTKYLKIVVTVATFLPKFSDSLKLSLMPVEDDFEHDYPILLLTYSSAHKNNTYKNTKIREKIDVDDSYRGNDRYKGSDRYKRSIEDDYEEETNKLWDDDNLVRKAVQLKKIKRLRNTCRRRPLYVDFSEIKYDTWIVQPSGYEAYQCAGRCFYPVAEHLNPTKHAIVQALLHSVAPSKVTRSCCVPTSLDSISILYVDTNGVLTYRYAYKDMVVRECGCR